MSNRTPVLVLEGVAGGQARGASLTLGDGGWKEVESSFGFSRGVRASRFGGMGGGWMDGENIFSGGLWGGSLEDGGGGVGAAKEKDFGHPFFNVGGGGGFGGGGALG
ncbi:MAG TPA: hypothetical protein DEO44_05305 [Verrucomicrobia subdivision 6 bacterium]|nr:hypothetical protein [Verrucomicrobia subdivision 6 bacterium]